MTNKISNYLKGIFYRLYDSKTNRKIEENLKYIRHLRDNYKQLDGVIVYNARMADLKDILEDIENEANRSR